MDLYLIRQNCLSRVDSPTRLGWLAGTLVGCLGLIATIGNSASADEAVLLPTAITLTGPEARQTLLLEERKGDHFVGPLTDGAKFESSDPNIVRIDGHVAVPVANGKATITATAGERKATAEVVVDAMDQPFQWNFRNHVEPVLSKAACNTGGCHGALAGKKGLKLTLGAFDPKSDFAYITRQARSRRVVPSDPGRSLILMKPTGAVPHKGGVRFGTDSLEYRILSQWIAAGTPAPNDKDPRLDRLEILPPASVLKHGAKQPLIVRAHYTDGHSEDVTQWAKYTSTDESVAQIDPATGLITVAGHGEAAIKAWFSSYNVVATVSVAYEKPVSNKVFADAPRRNFIDERILEKLESLNLPPSPPATDADYLRRAMIDTIGMLPTIEETKAFMADSRPDKKDRLIEQLLSRPEFVDYWAYKWSDLLLVNGGKMKHPAMWAYYHWIRNQVEANTPWDEFVRNIVTATGSTVENGAANFFTLHKDPTALAENVSLAFLGMSINCAKCHNHPLEKWTNDQYYGMANLFSRVHVKASAGDGNSIIYTSDTGELLQPRTGRPLPPQPLDGESLSFDSSVDRREHLARWLTSPDNPYFTRAIVNRVWANFFNVGIVENVDDLRLTNPPSNEKLMATSAKFLVEHKYDLKALMRAILQSHAYARSSQTTPENAHDQRFYSHYYPRRMMAEVLLDACSQVTGAPTKFGDFAANCRALQLPDVNVDSYFLKSFGRPARDVTCECERNAQPTMVQVLHISNGDTINQKLEAKNNRIEQLLESKAPDDAVVEEVYLTALSRYPTAEEKSRLLATWVDSKESNRRVLIEDLYWGVLSSKEFLFNH